jgi:hypothetical protein
MKRKTRTDFGSHSPCRSQLPMVSGISTAQSRAWWPGLLSAAALAVAASFAVANTLQARQIEPITYESNPDRTMWKIVGQTTRRLVAFVHLGRESSPPEGLLFSGASFSTAGELIEERQLVIIGADNSGLSLQIRTFKFSPAGQKIYRDTFAANAAIDDNQLRTAFAVGTANAFDKDKTRDDQTFRVPTPPTAISIEGVALGLSFRLRLFSEGAVVTAVLDR